MKITQFLNNLSPMRAMMFGFAIAAIYYFVAYDSGSLLQANIAKYQEDLEKIKAEMVATRKKIEKAQMFEKTSTQLGQTLHSVLTYVPENTNHSDLMKIISNEVKASGERLVKMRGLDDVTSSSFYKTVAVEVELQGSFVQHMLFLSFLTRVDQILTVDQLTIDSRGELMDSEAPWSTMRVTIKGYRYIPPKDGENAAS